MIKILRFDWILRIRIYNPLFLIVLIQPIYVIWMYKIGRLGEKQLHRKPNKIFLLSCLVLLLCIIITVILISKTLENTELIRFLESKSDQLENMFVGLMIVCWVYCSLYSMTMSFKIEESLNEDYFPTIQEKAFRFFQILYWIFGIWVVQPRINELEEKINQPITRTV
jgi:hypothetical protein